MQNSAASDFKDYDPKFKFIERLSAPVAIITIALGVAALFLLPKARFDAGIVVPLQRPESGIRHALSDHGLDPLGAFAPRHRSAGRQQGHEGHHRQPRKDSFHCIFH